MRNDILTETITLGAQRHLRETEPGLSNLARVERAQELVDDMPAGERADYFEYLAERGLVASATA